MYAVSVNNFSKSVELLISNADFLEEEVMMKLEELIDYMKEEANSIGGKFRAPGIEADCIKAMKSVFKSKKVRI